MRYTPVMAETLRITLFLSTKYLFSAFSRSQYIIILLSNALSPLLNGVGILKPQLKQDFHKNTRNNPIVGIQTLDTCDNNRCCQIAIFNFFQNDPSKLTYLTVYTL